MIVVSRYFGEIEYTEDEVLVFPRGLYGFEEEQSFLLLPFSKDGILFGLQSTKTPELSFTLMHPFSLDPSYAPKLQAEDLKELEAEQSEELYYYVTCAVKEPVSESTINMKCPLAINSDTRRGMQVILENPAYGMRHRLSDFARGEGSIC